MVTGYIYAAGTSQVSLTGTENTVGNYVQASGDSQIQMDGTINTVKAGVWSNGSSSKVILSATDTNRVKMPIILIKRYMQVVVVLSI